MSLTGYVLRRLLQPIPVVLGVTILVFFLIHLVPGIRRGRSSGTRRRRSGRAPARGVGPRRAAPRPVREVHEAARPRRPGRVALLRHPRPNPRVRAAAGDPLADRLRDAALGAARCAARRAGARASATVQPTMSCAPCRSWGSASRPSGSGSSCCSSSGSTSGGFSRRRLRRGLPRSRAFDVPPGPDGCAGDRADPDPQPAREPARGVRLGLRDDGALEGLSERRVLVRHALRNAAISTISVLGVNIGFLVGGTLVVEQVFAVRASAS